jgi:hypothetical protein
VQAELLLGHPLAQRLAADKLACIPLHDLARLLLTGQLKHVFCLCRDEVQDFVQAELLLDLLVLGQEGLTAGSLFWCGDTAQTIARGACHDAFCCRVKGAMMSTRRLRAVAATRVF